MHVRSCAFNLFNLFIVATAHVGIDDDVGRADGADDIDADGASAGANGASVGADGIDTDEDGAVAGTLASAGPETIAGPPVAMPAVKNERVDNGWVVKSTHSLMGIC